LVVGDGEQFHPLVVMLSLPESTPRDSIEPCEGELQWFAALPCLAPDNDNIRGPGNTSGGADNVLKLVA
jgi:hypothetical protein